MELEHDIRAFVVESFLLGKDDGLSPTQSLLETGVVDSTGILELVTFLEQEYRIQVNDRDLVPENLDSIDNIVRFVQVKLAARDAA